MPNKEDFIKKNCSNCGWNLFHKGGLTKTKCQCPKKCINFSQWKPIKPGINPIKPKENDNAKE